MEHKDANERISKLEGQVQRMVDANRDRVVRRKATMEEKKKKRGKRSVWSEIMWASN